MSGRASATFGSTSSAPALEHERILASAGSGKTFRLSGRAIELLRRGAPPETLLASTFTRAAAAEIRDRVLGRLAKAALDAKAREGLAVAGGLAAPSEAEAIETLERVVAVIDRLQIRTLDSLFASMVMAFAAELGVPPEPRVLDELETSRLEALAVERMLEENDAESLLATIAAINKGHPRLSIGDAILGAVRPVLRIYRQSLPSAWEWPKVAIADADDVRAMVAELAAAAPRATARQAKAITADLTQLQEVGSHDVEAWGKLLAGGIGAKVRAGDHTYYGELHGDVVAAYEPLVEHAVALAIDAQRRHTLGLRDLAAVFDNAFRAIKASAGAVTFDDLTFALGDAAALPGMEELFFRLDARFRHALLDEFQDTSVPQWRALLPIIREITSGDPNERSLFVVGDLKQSIYGWRGASPALLDRLPALVLEGGELPMRNDTLTRSFRSSQVVLDAVNEVFDGLSTNPALHERDPAHRSAVEGWLRNWIPHTAAKAGLAGVVELHVTPKVEGARNDSRVQQERTLDHAAGVVAELAAAYPRLSIGVLCRRNAPVAGMLNRLRDSGVAASARGVGSLLDAASVTAFIAAVTLADHPDHTIACFHVGRSPLGPVVGLGPDDHHADRALSRHRVSAALRAKFDRDGYAETFRRWRDAVLPSVDAREARRLDELIEHAVAFDLAGASERRPADVSAALGALELDEDGGGGVTVMNVHQSKGLEFDAVVLCDIDQGFRMRTPIAAVRAQGDPQGPFVRVTRWAAESVRDGEVAKVIDEVTEESYREFLSTLYVALTRAKRGLFVVVGPAETKSGMSFGNSFAGILRGAWCPNASAAGRAFSRGDRGVLAQAEDGTGRTVCATAEPRTSIRLAAPSGLRIVKATSASERERPILVDGEEAGPELGAARRWAMLRGVLAHAMMESIEWAGEEASEDPSNDELLDAARRAVATLGVRLAADEELRCCSECLALVRDALAVPEVRRQLVRPKETCEVRREWRFARIDPKTNGLEQGAIDRLVLTGPRKQPTSARILDFKTDRESAVESSPDGKGTDFGASLVHRYRPQMEAYRTAVAERFRIDPNAISATLILLAPRAAAGVGGQSGPVGRVIPVPMRTSPAGG
ncbi:MAG: UvrD-helicase domain-containing protein [Phycisphaerae bacterium]|nr:UvrD-helicase domain-containing protein [Phycisphaerae bacterium]